MSLGEGSEAVLLEDVAAVKVMVVIEMIVYRGVDRSELLESLNIPGLAIVSDISALGPPVGVFITEDLWLITVTEGERK